MQHSQKMRGNMNHKIMTGIENLKTNLPEYLKGKRLGLLANPASVDKTFTHSLDIINRLFPGQLTALFSPQHGFYAEKQDNILQSNPNLEIIAVGGDGDGLGIGAGHFVAAGRRNVNMTYIIFDNAVYGLTKGQASPTLKLGEKTKSLPTPNTNYNVNPIGLAIASGFTFAARGYSYDVRQLKDLIVAAVKHKGLAFLDVLQPCPTYNDINTKDWFSGEDRIDETTKKPMPRIYKLEDTDYDPVVHYSDETELNQKKTQAIVKSLEWDSKIPTGIFYKNELITPYTRRLTDKIPNYVENPSALQNISKNNVPITKINQILDLYKVQSS